MGLLSLLFPRPRLARTILRALTAPAPISRPATRSLPAAEERSSPPAPVASLLQSISGTCRVVDGDTLCIRGHSIRLAGIDAPELEHPYGNNAKWALIRLCQGQTIRAEFVGESSYERHVAICYLPDGRDLSAEMVRLGHAVDWRKYSGGRYRHLEVPGIRQRLWRCDARQKGRMPPSRPA